MVYNLGMGYDEPKEIDIDHSWERNYWCTRLSCTPEQLKIAVEEVGPSIPKVKEHLIQLK